MVQVKMPLGSQEHLGLGFSCVEGEGGQPQAEIQGPQSELQHLWEQQDRLSPESRIPREGT